MVKTVVITGGAGRIAYSLIPLVLNGALFEGEEIKLCLLDMEICADKLAGIKVLDNSTLQILFLILFCHRWK